MFWDLTCTSCRRRHLVGHRSITSCRNDAEGIRLEISCPCGGSAVTRTGRRGTATVGDAV